ncbi:DUF190 domain-containing protein [Streptomyces graminifolii]|uniref:DUF190 domain-containing protein n=1 Tax=Streptomyces TaxID=1883 RepID=UPI0036B48603
MAWRSRTSPEHVETAADEPRPLDLVVGCRLTVTVSGGSTWRHKPLYCEIVRRAKAHGLANTLAFHAMEGFGLDGVIHTTRSLTLTDGMPLWIVAVDEEARIMSFLPEVTTFRAVESIVVDQVRQFVPR